jgi:hypothetical protein
MVYNPFNETSQITLNILQEDGEIYFTKTISVDQTVQNWVIQDYPAGNIKLEMRAYSETGADAVKTFTVKV